MGCGPSTLTLVNKRLTEYSEHSMQVFHESMKKEHLALNHLKGKSARYESHKDLRSRCTRDRLMPKFLKLELESIIDNFHQEFTENCFPKLKDYLFDLMNDMIKFCDKRRAETKLAIQCI